MVNRGVWFSLRDFIPGNDDAELVCQVHLLEHVATSTLAGGRGNGSWDPAVMETCDQLEDAGNDLHVKRGFLEEFVLTVSILSNFVFREFPRK